MTNRRNGSSINVTGSNLLDLLSSEIIEDI
jgi:hypothetical protein